MVAISSGRGPCSLRVHACSTTLMPQAREAFPWDLMNLELDLTRCFILYDNQHYRMDFETAIENDLECVYHVLHSGQSAFKRNPGKSVALDVYIHDHKVMSTMMLNPSKKGLLISPNKPRSILSNSTLCGRQQNRPNAKIKYHANVNHWVRHKTLKCGLFITCSLSPNQSTWHSSSSLSEVRHKIHMVCAPGLLGQRFWQTKS